MKLKRYAKITPVALLLSGGHPSLAISTESAALDAARKALSLTGQGGPTKACPKNCVCKTTKGGTTVTCDEDGWRCNLSQSSSMLLASECWKLEQ